MYQPKPADTSAIKLPEDIADLVEKLAENSHDVWAKQRMSEGWTYGPSRDDATKKHPDLVPYADLPESEKEYDRLLSTQTIKLILSLGYQIKAKS
jgi:hypothetical protein